MLLKPSFSSTSYTNFATRSFIGSGLPRQSQFQGFQMSSIKVGDRVAIHGTILPDEHGKITGHTLVRFPDFELYLRNETLRPLKKRGKLVAKVKTHIAETFGIGHVDVDWENDINLNEHIGKRVEVTVRLIEGER